MVVFKSTAKANSFFLIANCCSDSVYDMTSPTQRSIALQKKRGCFVQVVEKWNPFAKIRQDLFGCIDLVSVGFGGILGIQACARSSVAARLEKSMQQPPLKEWLACGGRFAVQGWGKIGKGRKTWKCREIFVLLNSDGTFSTLEHETEE